MLKMDSTSHRYLYKVSPINILSVDIVWSACFTNCISDSHEPPIYGLRGGLNFHVMFLEFKCCVILLLLRSFTNALSSYSPPAKLLLMLNVVIFNRAMAQWLRRWIPNPGVSCSKPLVGSKVDSAFHPSEVGKMSTRNFWELSGKK